VSPRRSLAGLLVAVTGCAVLAGCSGSDAEPDNRGPQAAASRTAQGSAPPGPPDGPSSAPRVTTDPSPGCGPGSPKQGQTAFRYRGVRRPFMLALPNTYTGGQPAPLVLNFHGLGSNAIEQAAYSRLPSAGPQDGFIVATPDTQRSRSGWKLPGMRDGEADIAFADALLDHLEKRVCIDRNREFAAGMSNGAGLSAALVCGLKGRLAAVAAVSGVNLAVPCATTRTKPTTIIAFHGTSDKIVPYRGGAPFQGRFSRVPAWMRPPGGRINLPAVESIAAGWARNFGCGPARDGVGGGEVRLRRWSGCRDGAVIELHTVTGGGHTWPGSLAVEGLGKTTSLIDATALMLEAFAKHPAVR
jgi:polyhydroxybutyrate depolymerase